MTRREAVLVLAGSGARTAVRAPRAVERAARYLWGRQAADGGWHSATYGLLRSGQSLAPFVLGALLRVPRGPADGVRRALAFIERQVNAAGAVGLMNPLAPDYPNYATALAVLALCRTGNQQRASRLVQYLREQQLTEQNGWSAAHPAYGAWGMGGERRTPPDPGHVDLSMTRYVMQALAAAGGAGGDPAFARAQVFLDRCRNPDGGFCFSTVELGANKAGQHEGRYRSYGTATADGMLSLVAAGAGDGDERVAAARRWLVAHHEPGKASGFVDPKTKLWAVGLRFYYAAACAEAVPGLVADEELLGDQRADGSWMNPEPLVKENDPLIATALAVRALTSRVGRLV